MAYLYSGLFRLYYIILNLVTILCCSNVQRDSRCLAKFKDGIWYTAVVENCLNEGKYVVKYDSCGSTETLHAYDILPIGKFRYLLCINCCMV